MSERLIHVQRAEDTKHWTGPTEARCPCKPESEVVSVKKAVGAPEGRRDFCIGRGHVIVAWSDEGSALYICDRCYAELVLDWAA